MPTRKAKLFTLLKPNSILERKGHKATRGNKNNNNNRERITATTTISKARQALES